MKKKSSTLIIALAALCPLMAQQKPDSTFQQSLTLEREFSPIIRDANKIDRQPAIEQINTTRSKTTYANIETGSIRSQEIGKMKAGQVVAESGEASDQKGYLSASLGNYWNADLKAGLRFGEFTVDGAGFFTKGDIHLPYAPTALGTPPDVNDARPYWESRYLNGEIRGAYNHEMLNEDKLSIAVGASGHSYDFFPFTTSVDRPKRDQSWGTLEAGARYESDYFDLDFNFERTNISTPGISDNVLSLSGKYGWYDADTWLTVISANVSQTFAEEDSYFAIKPAIEVSYLADRNVFSRTFARLAVGSDRPTLSHVLRKLPLTLFNEEYKTPFDCFDLTLGYENNDNGQFRYGGSINLTYTKDELCSQLIELNGPLPSYSSTAQPGLFTRITNDDCFAFEISANAEYELNRLFAARAEMTYQHQSIDDAGFGEPDFEADFHLLSRPGKFVFDLAYHAAIGRSMPLLTMMDMELPATTCDDYDRGNIYDLSVRIDFNAKKNLQLSLWGNNLLNRANELWPCIPGQRINIHAGFNWKF